MRIIFAGTPDISAAVLQALLAAKYNIVACLTQPDRPQGRGLHLTPSPVKVLATEQHIPVLQPQSLKDLTAQQQIQELHADLMIVLAYGLILPKAVLEIPKLGCINIHASILPRWRGAAPIQHAILTGDTQTGITIMQMDAGLDTGDILEIYPCTIDKTDTSATLLDKLSVLAQTAIIDSLHKLQQGGLKAVQQNNNLATYAHKIAKQQAQIDWQLPTTTIDCMIRAYNPWPVAFTNLHNQVIRIWQAHVAEHVPMPTTCKPGEIISVDKTGIYVGTGSGVLCVTELQFPGKKQLPAFAVCNAHTELCAGNIFTSTP